MTYTEVCKLPTIYKGEWVANTSYYCFDLVVLNNSYYLAIDDSYNTNPLDNTTYWTIVTSDHVIAGRIISSLKGVWANGIQYKTLDVVSNNNSLYMARKNSINKQPVSNTDSEYWMFLVEPDLIDLAGATSNSNGSSGLVPEPQAGDEDKVLSGDGNWKHKLETSVVAKKLDKIITVDGVPLETHKYGYMNNENEFVGFMTYQDVIDSCMIGDAEPEDVLIGKTFSNSRARGLCGTMHNKNVANSGMILIKEFTGDSDRNLGTPFSYSLTDNDMKQGYSMLIIMRIAVGNQRNFRAEDSWPNSVNNWTNILEHNNSFAKFKISYITSFTKGTTFNFPYGNSKCQFYIFGIK